ncbi:MAG: hypothetical protein ACRDP7_43835 [Trebonia sp.]
MTDWSPAGESFTISERASASAKLERAYRRLIRFYPRSFRRENTEEIIAVLLATAREDQRRPSITEAADLLRGALRMQLGLSRCPRTVLASVRLMDLGALAQAAVLVSLLLTAGDIQSSARAAWAVSTAITVDVGVILVAIAGGSSWRGPTAGAPLLLGSARSSPAPSTP